MDYLNSDFISLSDFDDLDTKIASLIEQKNELSQQILEKTSGNTREATPKLPSQAIKLMELISDPSNTSSPEKVNELITNTGDLAVLTRLRSLLESKQLLESQCTSLQASIAVENEIAQLSSDSDIRDFRKVADNIKRNAQQDYVGDGLQTLLRSVVDVKRIKLSSALSSILKEVKWLSPDSKIVIDSERFKEITKIFEDLIELQASIGVPSYPDAWWGIQTLIEPFTIRFNYHFRESHETSKLSKPEWALSYVEEFLSENITMLELIIGDRFSHYGKIGVYEIISAILAPVREKLIQMLSLINSNISSSRDDAKATDQFGRLLSHLIFETTSFDQRLRNCYKYNPFIENFDIAPGKKWMGLTGDILISKDDNDTSVSNWLNLELRLAEKRFNTEIISPENAFQIDNEFTASSDSPESVVKPTYSAYGLTKLFDILTSHFKTINIVKFQLKYVSQIQLVLLDQYLEHLKKQFRQFSDTLGSKLISSLMATNSKTDTKHANQTALTNGLSGLETLTGIYCSIKFVIEKMEEWAEDLIYIQLWKYCETSSDESGESIFDAHLKEYNSLLSKAAKKYEDLFKKEVRGALRDYVNDSTWNIEDPSYKIQVSSLLVTFTTLIPAYAASLRKSLPDIDYAIITSRMCDAYAFILLEYVVTNNQFTKIGFEQLRVDLDYLHKVLREPLLLDESQKFSNAQNKNYLKVLQSLELIGRFDASGAKLLKRSFQNGESVRSQFDSRLDSLSDSECLDLLFRII